MTESKSFTNRTLPFLFVVAVSALLVFDYLALGKRQTFETKHAILSRAQKIQLTQTKQLEDFRIAYRKFEAEHRLLNSALFDIYSNCSNEEFSASIPDEFTVRPARFGRFALNKEQRRLIDERLWNEQRSVAPSKTEDSATLESQFAVPSSGIHRLVVEIVKTHSHRLHHGIDAGRERISYSKSFDLECGKEYVALFDPSRAGDSAKLSVTGFPDQTILFQNERIDGRVSTLTGVDDGRAHWSPNQFANDSFVVGPVAIPIASIAYGRGGKDVKIPANPNLHQKAMYMVRFRLESNGPVTAAADDPVAIRDMWTQFDPSFPNTATLHRFNSDGRYEFHRTEKQQGH